ncbi:hypothetical protein CSUI_011189, partial [Cystoisospora suis]
WSVQTPCQRCRRKKVNEKRATRTRKRNSVKKEREKGRSPLTASILMMYARPSCNVSTPSEPLETIDRRENDD